MNNIIKTLAIATLAALPGLASANWVSHTSNPYVYLEGGDSHTVYHDLTDFGVPDENEATAAWLRLSFADTYFGADWAYDIANISAEGVSATYEVDGSHWFGFDVRWLSVGDAGIADINADGVLAVTVTASDTWGNDFWWKESTLYADIQAVPAPGALALLGLGLLGMGAARRRRSA